MDFTVIICTYNRGEHLRRTLEGFHSLATNPEWRWELLVVDNNSSDDTRKVCDSFDERLPIRYLFESRQGKSFALNRAVTETKAPLLLFTDDDVDVDPAWASRLLEAAAGHPDIAFFGGRVLPRWERTPPRWAAEHIDWLMINVHVDKGEREVILQNGSAPFLVGANVAFRRSVFDQGVRFREDIGPSGSDGSSVGNLRGEENDLEKRLMSRGDRGLYVPGAIVYHRHPPHRCTERYLRNWYMGWAMADVRMETDRREQPSWFGAPRTLWKRAMLNGIKYGLTRWTCPSKVWLGAEIKMAFAWGAIREHRRQAAAKS